MHARLPAVLTLAACCSIATAQWVGPTGPQNLISYTTGNGYIGPTGFVNPVVRFDVVDNAQTGRIIGLHSYIGTPQNNERTTAIWGETNNPTGRALQGFNFATTGNGAGIWAESASTAGTGLRARNTATSGSSMGGMLEAASPSGFALFAQNTANSGTPVAVAGTVLTATGYSGYFTGGSVYLNGAKLGIGTPSPTLPLVVSSSQNSAVALATNSSTFVGTIGNSAAGLIGQISSSTPGAWSAGVRGTNASLTNVGIGVLGYHGGSGVGVYGYAADAAGFAGYFNGKVEITGTLAKGGGSFKIDHPLDPENKYLYHSFVESPDMMNIYNGLITTDQDGYATVTMPDWFDTLNRDFRYQLTVIDESDAGWTLAKVVRKMHKNQFTIRTNFPNIEVSWQVTGIRQDNFANANRIPVEQDKESWNKGRYLHPAAFGKDLSRMVSTQVDDKGNAVPIGNRRAPAAIPVAPEQPIYLPAAAQTPTPPQTAAILGGR
jgi:hypothetical protein